MNLEEVSIFALLRRVEYLAVDLDDPWRAGPRHQGVVLVEQGCTAMAWGLQLSPDFVVWPDASRDPLACYKQAGRLLARAAGLSLSLTLDDNDKALVSAGYYRALRGLAMVYHSRRAKTLAPPPFEAQSGQ